MEQLSPEATLEEGNILGVEITIEEIRARIQALSDCPQMNLKTAMAQLKLALKANPEACNLLQPEEIGAMVGALYKTTNTQVLEVTAKTAVKAGKKVNLADPDLVNKAMDEL